MTRTAGLKGLETLLQKTQDVSSSMIFFQLVSLQEPWYFYNFFDVDDIVLNRKCLGWKFTIIKCDVCTYLQTPSNFGPLSKLLTILSDFHPSFIEKYNLCNASKLQSQRRTPIMCYLSIAKTQNALESR